MITMRRVRVVLVHGILSSKYSKSIQRLKATLDPYFEVHLLQYISGPFPAMVAQVKFQLMLMPKFSFYVGHSMGGIIGYHLKQKGLITVNSPFIGSDRGYHLQNNDFYQRVLPKTYDYWDDSKSHGVTQTQSQEVLRYIRSKTKT